MGSGFGPKWWVSRFVVGAMIYLFVVASAFASAQEISSTSIKNGTIAKLHSNSTTGSSYRHVWPELRFGWKIVVGTIIGFVGAAFGSVGGVGGGGIFVPMLALILGFDTRSSAAVSKCMITGTALATVYYNLRLRHPNLDMPLIDYDLALLFQPMLMLGISLGVAFNVIFGDWMITVSLIILFTVTCTRTFFKGIETWKKETILKKEAGQGLESNDSDNKEVASKPQHELTSNGIGGPKELNKKNKVSVIKNVRWKELGLLVAVWFTILALQIAKNHTRTCSMMYWACNLLQLPVAMGVSGYQVLSLYRGKTAVSSKGGSGTNWRVGKLILYCFIGILAGVVGGLLGLGGGFILGPLFLEMGIPPQVSAATATFAMSFSSSMSVFEFYLLKRFPVPYALYLTGVSSVAAISGQYVVRKMIKLLGRASIIIFVLAFLILVSAAFLGGVGIADMIETIEHGQYMGFHDICAF